MDEWIPAVFKCYHRPEPNLDGWVPATDEELKQRTHVFVKPYVFPERDIERFYRSRGCDATRFWLVRADSRIVGDEWIGGIMACDHEILTD